VTCDLRGHGESGGTRGFVRRFGDYLEDLRAVLADATVALAGLPGAPAASPPPQAQRPILLGHSMGGLVALQFALAYPDSLRALALSSPFLGLKLAVPGWKRTLGLVASVLAPKLRMPSGLNPADLSHDSEVGRSYAADPLVTHEATARWFTETTAAQADVWVRAGRVRVPTLMQVAGDDRIVDAAVSQTVFDRLGAVDKNLTVYPGLFHEIFNEAEADRRRVLSDLTSWLADH
jgi:alpha-beta hydrolase superfamily lysophospholipase